MAQRRERGGDNKQASPGRKPPALPESMDDSIKKVYEKENALRDELRALQAKHADQIKTARANRAASPKQDPERGKKLDALDADQDKLQDRIHEITTQINDLRKSVNRHRNMAEGMSILELKCGPLRDDIKDINQRLRRIEDEAANMKTAAKRIEARLTTTKVAQLEKELNSVNKQIDQYKSGKAATTAISHLEQQRSKAERTLEQAKEYWEILEKVFPLTEEIAELNAKKQAKTKELDEINKKKDEWKKTQDVDKEAPEQRKQTEAKIDALNKERASLRAEIDAIRKQKDKVRTDTGNDKDQGERKTMSDQIDGTRKRMDELRDELKKLQGSIPSKSVKFEIDLLSTIIGPKGSRIKQLQEDYGVYIQVEDDGTVNIRGTKDAVADAEDAVKQILTSARDNRTKDTVKLPPSVKVADVIGRQGANIKSIQNRSGVQRIDINSDKGEIEITGASAAVAEAKAMFEELLGNQHREVVAFKQQWANFLTPDRKQAILDETGVKFVNIEREKGTITLVGKKEDCEAAKAKLETYFNSLSESSVQMHLGEDLYRIVQNARGNLLQKIQDATSTVIEDRKLPATTKPQGKGNPNAAPCLLKIHGPKEGVAAAQAMISDLMSGLKLEYPLNRFNILMRDRGQLLRTIENGSGAIVLVQKGTSNVSISLHGQEKARNKAKELVEQNLNGLEIPTTADKTYVVLNKASAIENDHPGVSVCVDNQGGKSVIVIVGTDAAARDAAKKEVEELLTKAVASVQYNPVLFDALWGSSRGVRGSKDKSLLKSIETETGANIHISKEGTITIMGDAKVLSDAEAKVRALLEQEGNKLANVALKTRDVIPRVIGRGGATIQKLQKDHNVHVNIDNEKLTAAIYGEGAQACKEEIESIISKFLAEKESKKGGATEEKQ